MALILDIVFALSEGVPKLNGLVTGARDNLTVISAEANGQNIGGVADETAGCQTSVQVPETESVIPGGRKSELTVG